MVVIVVPLFQDGYTIVGTTEFQPSKPSVGMHIPFLEEHPVVPRCTASGAAIALIRYVT